MGGEVGMEERWGWGRSGDGERWGWAEVGMGGGGDGQRGGDGGGWRWDVGIDHLQPPSCYGPPPRGKRGFPASPAAPFESCPSRPPRPMAARPAAPVVRARRASRQLLGSAPPTPPHHRVCHPPAALHTARAGGTDSRLHLRRRLKAAQADPCSPKWRCLREEHAQCRQHAPTYLQIARDRDLEREIPILAHHRTCTYYLIYRAP